MGLVLVRAVLTAYIEVGGYIVVYPKKKLNTVYIFSAVTFFRGLAIFLKSRIDIFAAGEPRLLECLNFAFFWHCFFWVCLKFQNHVIFVNDLFFFHTIHLTICLMSMYACWTL